MCDEVGFSIGEAAGAVCMALAAQPERPAGEKKNTPLNITGNSLLVSKYDGGGIEELWIYKE